MFPYLFATNNDIETIFSTVQYFKNIYHFSTLQGVNHIVSNPA